MATTQALRRPAFLARSGGSTKVENAAFKTPSGTRFRPALVANNEEEDDGQATQRAAEAAIAEADKLAAQFTERTAAALDVLRATAERLAAEARTDALEIGFLVARRILDMELTASPEPLVNLVRTAVKRLGESRKIAVHLSPTDARALSAVIEERGPQAVASATIAKVEIVADGSLGRGDCLVDGDLVTVDGRIGARMEELRRALDAAAEETAS
jgi:flagellar assembly protein FliH